MFLWNVPLSSQPWGNALPFLVFSKHILVGSLTEGLVYEGTSGRLRAADREVLYDLVVVVLVDVVSPHVAMSIIYGRSPLKLTRSASSR